MKFRTLVLGAVAGAGVFAAMAATPASAAVVCNRFGDCWHTTERYDYPPEARVTVHEDDWKPGPDVVIREHRGRGYWSGDAWTDF